MATIRAASEMLIRGGISGPQIHRIGCNLRAASVRMQELIDELFDGCLPVGGGELVNVRVHANAALETIPQMADFRNSASGIAHEVTAASPAPSER